MDNRNNMTMEEVHGVILKIMKKFHAYCKKYNLRYVMMYGTLLGAVRHKGFIPWDDDLDVGMPRPDYERFLELVSKIPISSELVMAHHSTDSNYCYSIPRIYDKSTKSDFSYLRKPLKGMGCWIDIFPIDGVPYSRYGFLMQWVKRNYYRKLNTINLYGTRWTKTRFRATVKEVLLQIYPFKDLLKKIDKLCKLYTYEDSCFVREIYCAKKVTMFRKSDIDYPILMRFEEEKFWAPRNSEIYLKRIYGENYMELPPIDKRRPHTKYEWVR